MPGSNLANIATARLDRTRSTHSLDLLEGLQQAALATDPDHYIVFWNEAAAKLCGWTADEVHGRKLFDVLPSAEFRAAGPAIMARLAQGDSWTGQFSTARRDGPQIAISMSIYPVRDQAGTLTSVLCLAAGLERPAAAVGEKPVEAREPGLAALLARLRRPGYEVPAESSRSVLRDFGIAVLLYAIACAARVLLDQVTPHELPFVTFYPAVVAAAYLCGFWPTLALIAASAVTGGLWLSQGAVLGTIPAAIFAVVAIAVAAPTAHASRIHRSLRRKDEQLQLLNRELKHRLKNLFAVTSSVCQQTINSKIPRESMAKALAGRIQAIAQAQDLLGATPDQGSDLRSLAEAVLRPLCPDCSRIRLDGPTVTLPAEAAMPFALIMHELATNALKHGAWRTESGRVVLTWRLDGRRLTFTWQEQGGPPCSAAAQDGFGSTVIRRALSHAKVEHVIAPDGARCSIELPI